MQIVKASLVGKRITPGYSHLTPDTWHLTPTPYQKSVSLPIEHKRRELYTPLHRRSIGVLMEPAQYFPMKAAIRSRAKQQMLADPETCDLCACLDEELMRELTLNLFQSGKYSSLYLQCRSSEEAAEITDQMAAELVNTYRQIVQQRQDPTIQQLNNLL
ncbi:hypothetical protein K9N68_18225 [Kovacikia minuta CCNUW1]|uniref:hypothetical protein n=1 Tax=Kovacikia minuta TaxID=2931930 RepID=UPI001CCE86A3|nr:hypothetical protein [Kovacikia minuta]UBF23707.1 hypothetical protein K9N68_18225 [Kovacikia minuta CCNUW1]